MTMPNAFLGVQGSNVQPPLPLSQAAAAGQILSVTDTTPAPTDAIETIIGAAAGDRGMGVRVSGDAFSRVLISTDGSVKWSSGAAGADCTMARGAVALLNVSNDLAVNSIGRGFRVAEGANAKQGTAVLVAGIVTVANTSVTATSRIFCTGQLAGGTPGGANVSARTAGTSFTITSTNAADTSTVAFELFEVG